MRTNTFVSSYISSLVSGSDICVDMTAGNGNDTLFLSKLARKVYAFDISEEAIRNTGKKITTDNVILINDDHANVDRYICEKVRLFVFNLGYLPGSDESAVTRAESTLSAFRKAYDLLDDNGYIVMTFYKGHAGGLSEYQFMNTYFMENDISIVSGYRSYDHDLEPETVVIRK